MMFSPEIRLCLPVERMKSVTWIVLSSGWVATGDIVGVLEESHEPSSYSIVSHILTPLSVKSARSALWISTHLALLPDAAGTEAHSAALAAARLSQTKIPCESVNTLFITNECFLQIACWCIQITDLV